MDETELNSLPVLNDFEKIECVGSGVFGKVYRTKNPSTDRISAVKVQKLDISYKKFILKEYKILNDLCCHPNLPEFYGAYRKEDDLLFFMELCEGGPVIDLVRSLINVNRRMFEDHIAFILKETIKALNYLHGHLIAHGDVKGNNILLTARGEVKLVDFNLSRCCVRNRQATGKSRIGSPCWMAPEIISGDPQNSYGSRSDVWSLAITAIELGDGKAPYEDMHPTRAIFQIERNPPVGLYRPHLWSNKYNDFISECLVKNPEHRPLMMEVIAHPFITQVPEKDYHLTLELAKLLEDFREFRQLQRKSETLIDNDFFKTREDSKSQKMLVEDLSTLEDITEENILQLIGQRYDRGQVYTFIGDILLALTPDEHYEDLFNEQKHGKYRFKSLSDNAPHVFAIADSAYQNMLHYKEDQKIILSGETASGKTLNAKKIIEHLAYMGETDRKTGDLINSSLDVLILLTHARTPQNKNSTRCILQAKLTYSLTGNISGVIFSIYQLEKWRIANSNSEHSNFHVLRYFFDGMEALGKLQLYNLEKETKYRFLRNSEIAEDKTENIKKFMSFVNNLRKLNFDDDQLSTIWNILAAVIIIGEISTENNENELYNAEVIKKISENLNLDEYIFGVSIMNYYYVENNVRNERKATASEVRHNCDMTACILYSRLVDWIVNTVNNRFSFYRALYGDSLSISILDMFGFESYAKNHYEQLVVNCFNEQMQYLYHHLVFTMEMQEFEEEHIPNIKLYYEDNRNTLEEIFGNPDGLWDTIDEANRTNKNDDFILEVLENQNLNYIKKISDNSFTIVHYTGKVAYDITDFVRSTNDNLPSELVEILNKSLNDAVREMFTNKLSITGNLVQNEKADMGNEESIWEKALVHEKDRIKKNQNIVKGVYSQTSNKPIACKILRSTALKLLKDYSVDTGTGSTHFIRCIRKHANNSTIFNEDIVKQQILSLFVKSTAVIRKDGFPYRISFQEFLKRYKFLAFGFDEKVEMTKENCRLLLLRLNMEGWAIGRSKIFLKYYNLEYLCRLHEYHMKKIIKTQCMVRGFLAKKLMVLRNKKDIKEDTGNIPGEKVEAENVENDDAIDNTCNERIGYYFNLWRKHTIYEVILKYRAARQQDLIYLCQQVHIFNQVVLSALKENNEHIPLEEIDTQTNSDCILMYSRPSVYKLPFKLSDIHFFEPASLCDPWNQKNASIGKIKQELDSWDAPLNQSKSSITSDITTAFQKCHKNAINSDPYKRLQNTLFCRNIEIVEKSDVEKINTIPESKSLNYLFDKKVDSAIRPTVYKRKHSLLHTMPKESGLQKGSSASRESATRKLKSSNPIEELKLLGNKQEDSSSSEGPFNFQAMLRKTNLRHYSASYNDLELNALPITKSDNENATSNINTTNDNVI